MKEIEKYIKEISNIESWSEKEIERIFKEERERYTDLDIEGLIEDIKEACKNNYLKIELALETYYIKLKDIEFLETTIIFDEVRYNNFDISIYKGIKLRNHEMTLTNLDKGFHSITVQLRDIKKFEKITEKEYLEVIEEFFNRLRD